MKKLGDELLSRLPSSSSDYKFRSLVFHPSPFSSVSHLHLHVIGSKKSFFFWKFLYRYRPFCISVDEILKRLKQ